LNLEYDEPLSDFAFRFNLRRYSKACCHFQPENEPCVTGTGGGGAGHRRVLASMVRRCQVETVLTVETHVQKFHLREYAEVVQVETHVESARLQLFETKIQQINCFQISCFGFKCNLRTDTMGEYLLGEAVQVDPMKPVLKAPVTKRLKL